MAETMVLLKTAAWDLVAVRTQAIMASHAQGAGKKDRNFKVDDRTDQEVHHDGMVGEVAFHVWSGLPLPEIKARGGDGRGGDFFIGARGRGPLNVKCVRPGRNLVPRKGVPLLSEFYCLAWWDGHSQTVRLMGWVERSTMLAENNVRDFRIGPQLFYPWEQLSPMDELPLEEVKN